MVTASVMFLLASTRTTCGRWISSSIQPGMIKICNIIDEYTREHVAFAVDKKLDAGSVIQRRRGLSGARRSPEG